MTVPVGGSLPMWTVYDHPHDDPSVFVARLWIVDANEAKPTGEVIRHERLDVVREMLASYGLVSLMPSPGDDPVIIETWL